MPIRLFILFVLSSSCGLGPFAEEGGGADNLPLHSGGPFRTLGTDFDTPANEPYVVAQPVVSLLDPSVRQRADGSFNIHYTVESDTGSEIWQVDLPTIADLPLTPSLVLSADQDWEQGHVASVTILLVSEDHHEMYYEGGMETHSIGHAVSTDGGLTYTKDQNNPLFEGRDPYLVAVDDVAILVYADTDQQHIVWRHSPNPDGSELGSPETLITARSTVVDAFDQLGVSAPAMRVTKTLDGQHLYGLYYTGLNVNSDGDTLEAIGYQASFDGETWVRFLDGEPILDPGPAGAGGPAPVVGPSSGFLFFYQLRQGRGRIAVSVSP